jgi:hypothetical protein
MGSCAAFQVDPLFSHIPIRYLTLILCHVFTCLRMLVGLLSWLSLTRSFWSRITCREAARYMMAFPVPLRLL